MKASLWLLLLCTSGCLSGCGGGSSGPPPMATHLSVSAATEATAGTPLEVAVTALDANNNPVGSYSGTVHFSSTDGQAVLPQNSTLTNGTGTFSATLQTAGSQTVTATDTVTVSITGTSSPIDVGAGPATHFSISAPPTAQSGTTFDLTVTALDAANNVAKSYVGTVHFSSTDGQAVLPENSTLTDGTGSFPATLRTAGNQSITATDTVTTSIAGTSSSINVSGGSATHLSVSAPGAAQPGKPFNFTVTPLNAANEVASYAGTVHFTSTDAQAALPADATLFNSALTLSATLETRGSQTITATDTVTASITGTSSSIDVLIPPFYFSVATPTAAQSGTVFKFTVTALNTMNVVANNYSGTVHFSSTDGQAVLPANSTLTGGTGTFSVTLRTAGSQTITATDTAMALITGTSSSIDVSAGPPTHFSVTAPTPARSGAAFSFIVTARDAANNLADSYAGTVHFSSTDAKATLPANSTLTDGMGTFSTTLQTTGTQTITATDTITASISGTSNAIEVFVNCATKGEACGRGPEGECCPGLICSATSIRSICE